MSMKRRSILAALFATCCWVGPAASLNYPNRVIKMIVPFPPGGPIDTMARPLIKEGKVRALGIARAERWPALPAVPTLVESGFPDFTHDAWTGVVAPAGTPREVVDILNRAINDGLQSAEVKANMTRFSAIAKPGTPQDFAAFMQSELPKWTALVKLAGATAE